MRGVGADGPCGALAERRGEARPDLGRVAGGRRDGFEAARDVVRDAVGEAQRVALGRLNGEARPAGPALLVRHPDGAVERRPRVAVAGIEQVERLAREVEPALAVERGRVGRPDARLERALPRRDARVEGLRGRREVVRAVHALLVKVYVDGGQPAAVEREPRARLGLRRPRPVAVEVEQEVVEAPARPRLDVLARVRARVRGRADALREAGHVAVAAVGVQARVEDDHDLAEPCLGARVAARERVQRRHRGLRTHRLVAVDVVAQPDDGFFGFAPAGQHARCAQAALADSVDARHRLGRGDGQRDERPALGRLAVGLEGDARRRRGDGLGVGDDAVVRREAGAERVAEERLGCGDLRVCGAGEEDENGREAQHRGRERGAARSR